MKSYYIQLIRNGLTAGNVGGRYIGHTDEELSTEGIEQIKQMKEDYKYPDVEAVFSSPLKRCTQTAKLIYPNCDPIIIDGFIEYNFGEFEGKSAEELESHPVFSDWLAGKKGVSPPFGESNEDFSQRIAQTMVKVIDGVIQSGITKTAIVTHGGVIMALLAMFGLPEASMHEWLTPGGCGYTIRVTPSLWSQGRKFEVFAQIPEIEGEDEFRDIDDDFNVEDFLYD
ncbi:MAG: histidine phosphatase family protein [Acutalibacteraceae bacterium]|nr:histidine phosphatase family protein [Acutalibacteraceae bacterium]